MQVTTLVGAARNLWADASPSRLASSFLGRRGYGQQSNIAAQQAARSPQHPDAAIAAPPIRMNAPAAKSFSFMVVSICEGLCELGRSNGNSRRWHIGLDVQPANRTDPVITGDLKRVRWKVMTVAVGLK